MTQQRFIQKGK